MTRLVSGGPPRIAGDVRIQDGYERSVDGWLIGDPVVPSGGYGGWETASRTRRSSLTIWQGRDPFQVQIKMLLDRGGRSVQIAIDDLNRMATGSAFDEPPVVTISGAIMVPAGASDNWVIQDLAWEDQVRQIDHRVTRQLVTVTLLEHIDDKLLQVSTTKSRLNGKTVVKHYRVKKGDTLMTIAARKLGDQKRWIDIAAINGLRSSKPPKKLIGKLIKLP